MELRTSKEEERKEEIQYLIQRLDNQRKNEHLVEEKKERVKKVTQQPDGSRRFVKKCKFLSYFSQV